MAGISMDKSKGSLLFRSAILSLLLLITLSAKLSSQKIQFSLWADPMVAWYSSDRQETTNEGLKPGFSLGLEFDTYFAENYAFSTGISIVNAGGKLSYNDTIPVRLSGSTIELPEDESITYKLQYLTIPLGLKLRTNQIGYVTVFANVGLDPKVVIGAKCNIPSLNIEGENITEEIRLFNLGYHLNAGIEYSLGGSTAVALGLGFENNFLDVTYDFEDQPADKIKHNMVRFKIGVIF